MPKHILKIMLKTSDPDDETYIEFTKDMLEYTPIKALDTYPHFDPVYVYSSQFKRTIRRMTLKERIGLFFIEKHFYNTLSKNKDDKLKPSANQANENFMFFLEIMFCGNFPISSHEQSIAYYDENIMRNEQKSYSVLDFILPKNKKCFSYLKKKNAKYTVIGLTWVNDVLKHPEYSKIITYYETYNNNKNNLLESENIAKTNLDIEIVSFILNVFHNKTIWKDTLKDSQYYRDFEVNDLRSTMKNTIFKKIQEFPPGFSKMYKNHLQFLILLLDET